MIQKEIATQNNQTIYIDLRKTSNNEELSSILKYKVLNCTGFHLIIRIEDSVIIDFRRNLLNILESNDRDILGVSLISAQLLSRNQKSQLFRELRQKNLNIIKEIKIDISEGISKYFLCSLNIAEFNTNECMNIIAIDLTDYKELSEQFIANQVSTKELLDNAPVGVFKTTLNGRLLESNEYLAKSLGYPSVLDMNLKIKNLTKDLFECSKASEMYSEKLLASPAYFNTITKLKHNKGGTITAKIIAKTITHKDKKSQVFGFIEDISNLERTQTALFESEQYQKSIFEGSVDPIVILDVFGKCIAINPSFEKHFGYKVDSLIGHRLPNTDIYQDGTWEKWLSKCKKGEGISGIEYNRRLQDGTISPVRLTISPIFNMNSELIAVSLWYHSIHDIKDSQQKADEYFNKLLFLQYSATEMLALSSREKVIELIVDKISTLAKDSLIVYSDVNQDKQTFQIQAIRGLDDAMLKQIMDKADINPFKSQISINKKYIDVYLSRKIVKYHSNFSQFASGIFADEFNDFITKLLNISDVYMMGVCVEDRVLGVIHIIKRHSNSGILTDLIETFVNQAALVIDRKRTEEKLLEKEREFISVINTSGDVIILLDNFGQIVNINNSAAEILKLCPIECVGMKLCDNLVKHLGEFSKLLSDELLQITESTRYEEQYDGVYYDVRIDPIRDNNGEIKQFSIIARNIQAYKQIENTLIKSEKNLKEALEAKDKFFSIISHDLKNPISGFLMLAKTLNSSIDGFDKAELKEMFGLILDSATNIQTLLNNLLDWARTQRGNMPVNPSNFLLYETTINLNNIFSASLHSKNIKLNIDIPIDVSVYADYNMITTVVRNLVSNAIKFSYPNSEIEIEAQTFTLDMCSYVVLSVRDSGVGIPKERIDKLFSIGATQSTVGTADEKGTGIGLLLCKEFVELNGGDLSVKSQVGQGTQFLITIKAGKIYETDDIDWESLL